MAKSLVGARVIRSLEKLQNSDPPISATREQLRKFWVALRKAIATPCSLSDDSLRDLWAGTARDGFVPKRIRTDSGPILLKQVFVTRSSDLGRRVRRPDRVVVVLDEDTLARWIRRGARNLSKQISLEWTSVSAPARLLISTVPEITEVLTDEALNNATCQTVCGLQLVIDATRESIPCLMWEDCLFLDAQELGRKLGAERLSLLINEIAAAGWLGCNKTEALQRLWDARVEGRRAEVARADTLAERLLVAVGGRDDPLRAALGRLAHADFIQDCEPIQLAALTLAQFGPVTLTVLKETLQEEGLKPPLRWGTAEARAFVASIGFPQEFAASEETRREPEEHVTGPIELPPLHDFQVGVLEGIEKLISGEEVRRRAVVSLPTGGGKTRVTVEGAVRYVLAPTRERRTVLWIAQTDELCEQAVQAFRQVWVNLGTQGVDLRIVQMWGGNPTPANPEADRPVVVVASIQTLNSRLAMDTLEWLRKPGLVVVDECHHAIMPSYTGVLAWLDAGGAITSEAHQDEPPIIGLSATPFRTDDEESARLAKRFQNRWFPANQEKLNERLLAQGVLAKPEYEAFQSGSAFTSARDK